MLNSTNCKIPKKYHAAIKEVYQDEDGFWCILNKGYVWGVDETSVCNGENYDQLIEALGDVKKIK